MKVYLVYDGRAHLDTSEGAVLDCISCESKSEAVEEFLENWRGTDSVLYEYDSVDGELENELIVGSSRELIK